MTKFAFLILNYKSTHETEQCVDSIENLEQEENDVQIIIVDNDSQDGCVEHFRKMYKGKKYIHIIENENNAGFSRGNNIGYEYVYENIKPDFLVMINSDIECRQKDFLKRIKEIYTKTHFFVLGPDVYAFRLRIHQSPICKSLPGIREQCQKLKEQREILDKYEKMSAQGKTYVSTDDRKIREEKIFNFVKKYHLDLLKPGVASYKKKYENVVIHGSAIIFSREYLNKYIHALYPEPFYYGEEDLLYLKCMRYQSKIVYDPSVKVWHAAGASATNSKGDRCTLKREIFRYENFVKTKELYIEVLKDENFYENEIRK